MKATVITLILLACCPQVLADKIKRSPASIPERDGSSSTQQAAPPDSKRIQPTLTPDLEVPTVIDGPPAPGKRVRQYHPDDTASQIYHVLYLPTDWQPGKRYPLIVEFAGNKFRSNPGTAEGTHLGYGISGGKGVIWVSMPYVDQENQEHAVTWWGDVQATVDYCRKTVARVCSDYGGDASNVYIAGFSRGSIACNYIGLHDDEIAPLWRGFICHSHYDGLREWPYPNSDRESATTRLKRLNGRPQFISQEGAGAATRQYLNKVCPNGNFTFLALPKPVFETIGTSTHTDTWVLYDLPQRQVLRNWFNTTLKRTDSQDAEQ